MKHNPFSRLKRSGLYQRLRSSPAYDLYLILTNRPLFKERNREIAFYRALLGEFQPSDVIFDVGANIGEKTDTFLRIGARVIAIDPDENNQAILKQRFLRYRVQPKPVTVVGKAVGRQAGVETMLVCAPGSVFNTLSRKGAGIVSGSIPRSEQALHAMDYHGTRSVETTTLEGLIEAYGVPALIKIDVVGFELEVLGGLRRPVPCLSFEIGLPEFKGELRQCVEILGGLSSRGQFNYTWDRRNGFVLDQWLNVKDFLRVLESCGEGPLEVFWRVPK